MGWVLPVAGDLAMLQFGAVLARLVLSPCKAELCKPVRVPAACKSLL